MIAFVRGALSDVSATTVVVDVGGIGLTLHCTPRTTAALHRGQDATLAASLVVREDSMTLFGFAEEAERAMFELLQTASGVGPRLAQAVLAVHAPDAVRRAIAAEDLAALTAVPGIGRKGAQRMVLELRDKIGALPAATGGADDAGTAPVPAAGWQAQVQEALLGLGWSARDADRAVATVAEDTSLPTGGDAAADQVPTLLRAALRTLARS